MNKYHVGNKVRTKINYINDSRKEVIAEIIDVLLVEDSYRYKINFEPDDFSKGQGCTGCEGYVLEEDIIELCGGANKLRVWWIAQVGIVEPFYVPVESVEEGKKILDLLSYYDAWQLQNEIKPDYTNCGGLEMFDEEEQEWRDWYLETDNDYFEDVDEYCKQSERAEELSAFNQVIFEQVDWKKIEEMTR